jgi:predicted permease
VGKPISADQALATVVGVAAPGFNGTGRVGDSPDFFVPLTSGARASGSKFAARINLAWVWPVRIFGRMAAGVTFEDVRRDLDAAFQGAVSDAWTTNPRRTTSPAPTGTPRLFVTSGSQGLSSSRENLTRAIGMLGAVVGILLLIVSVNLTSLLLARGASRRSEMAVRLAIGARRSRLIRQLVTEAVFMTSCGALGGVVIARWARDGALAWLNRANPSFVVEPALDVRVLAFSAGIALIIAVVVGLIPAWRATRVDPNPSMKDGAAAVAGGRDLVGRALLAAQVALALVLVITAGLFIRTVWNLENADVGFNRQNVLLFRVSRTVPPNLKNPSEEDRALVLDQLADRIEAMPSVHSAGFSSYSLLGGDLAMPYVSVPGRPKAADEDRTVYTQTVSPGFFRAMEMPLVAGRVFTLADRRARLAVVNETFARRFFPARDPLGQRLAITKDPSAPEVTPDALVEIIGVVRDAKYMTVRETTSPAVFLSNVDPGVGVFAVRSQLGPTALVPAVQSALKEMPVPLIASEFRTQAEEVSRTYAEERNAARLSGLFGGVALGLTAIGLYGLLSYRVARRTREIGIRMALGAGRARVVRRVLADVLGIVAAGIAAGLLGASMVTRLIQNQFFGLSAIDPVAMTFAVLLMGAVAVLAALVPARRAARVDPLIALRTE